MLCGIFTLQASHFFLHLRPLPFGTESVSKKTFGMSCRIVALVLMWISVLAPGTEVSARTPYMDASIPPAIVERIESNALSNSLQKLHRRRYSPVNQGILAETLDGS